jgi:hypothetical protein
MEVHGVLWTHLKGGGQERCAPAGHYWGFFEATDGPIDTSRVPDYLDLFYEPFYQMMRQQLLAHEMEKYGELGAEVVTVMHVSPAKNTDFERVTSPGLAELGDSATDGWKSLLRKPDRLVRVCTQDLFQSFDVGAFPGLIDWHNYSESRYEFGRETT